MSFTLTKTSVFTGRTHSVLINTDAEKYEQYLKMRQKGTAPLIQDFFPELNADEREFIMTGCTPEEWNAMWEGVDHPLNEEERA